MMHFFPQVPAWALTRLPVRFARRCAGKLPSAESSASSRPAALQLLVDVSVIYQSDARTGIQRVVRALLLQLLKAPPTGYRICPVVATRRQGYCYVAPNFLDASSETLGSERKPVHVQSGDIFLALDLAAHLLPRHQTQILHWKKAGVQLHVLVYDLLPLLHPQWFNLRTTRNFERWIRWLAIYADSAICISQTVKAELHAWLNARFALSPTALPARTIALGADINASAPSGGLPTDSEALLKHMRSTCCVLMVGTLEPRKGHDQALAAFEQLWQRPGPAPTLVLVGRAGWRTEALQEKLRKHPEAGRRLFWPKDVSDEFLTYLYAACSGVLVASRAEGFGLPLIEAILQRKPVLARNLPVFQEIRLPGISYFDSDTSHGLADTLVHWLSQSRSVTNASSESQSDSFVPTWQFSAVQLLQALGLRNQFKPKLSIEALADRHEN